MLAPTDDMLQTDPILGLFKDGSKAPIAQVSKEEYLAMGILEVPKSHVPHRKKKESESVWSGVVLLTRQMFFCFCLL